MKENHYPRSRGRKFWALCFIGLLFFCMLCYMLCKLNEIKEQISEVDICCEPFVVSDEICYEEVVFRKREFPLSFDDSSKEKKVIKSDSIFKRQPYYCNRVIVYFKPDSNRSESVKYLESFGLKKVKECPNCGPIELELWGREGDIPISPEERGKIADSDPDPLSGGQGVITSLDYAIKLPPISEVQLAETDGYRTFDTIGNEVLIAVIDSGVDFNHIQNLKKYEWKNSIENNSIGIDNDDNCLIDDNLGYDFVNNRTYIEDINGHGTHIAGIIARKEDYNEMNLKMMNLKVFHGELGSLFNLLCALKYAINKEVDIINLSLGFYAELPPKVLEQVLNISRDKKILVIASSGNDGENYNDYPAPYTHYPSGFNADLDNIISVGALDDSMNQLWVDGNFGYNKVDIATPGENVVSTYLNNKYALLSGTSMAAGYATKVAALYMAKYNTDYLATKDCIISVANSQPFGSNRTIGQAMNTCASIKEVKIVLPNNTPSPCQ